VAGVLHTLITNYNKTNSSSNLRHVLVHKYNMIIVTTPIEFTPQSPWMDYSIHGYITTHLYQDILNSRRAPKVLVPSVSAMKSTRQDSPIILP